MITHQFTSGGFPLTVEHLQSIEKQMQHLSGILKLAYNSANDDNFYVPSDFFILEYRDDHYYFRGNNEGYILYKGEIYYCEANSYDPTEIIGFKIITETLNKTYADGSVQPYQTIKKAFFPFYSGSTCIASFSYNDIKDRMLTSLTALHRKTTGAANRPIYMNEGVPTACTNELNKTVPANAEFTDTKVTAVGNHYTPAADSSAALSASASGATAAWSIDVVKGVTLNRDAKGHVTGVSVTSGKIPANPNTDTKVTAVGNHYTPAADSSAALSASASGATAAWSIDVVKGVTLSRDAKGHVTGVSVTSGKIPANPNTDTGATSVEVTGSGNAVTAASYTASTRKLSLTKGTTFLTAHQSLAAYTPTASLPTMGIIHFGTYGSYTATYIHLMGPTNSMTLDNYSSPVWRLKFELSKRYLIIPMAHGTPNTQETSDKTACTLGISCNCNASGNSQTSSWTATQYAKIYLTGPAWITALVIGY